MDLIPSSNFPWFSRHLLSGTAHGGVSLPEREHVRWPLGRGGVHPRLFKPSSGRRHAPSTRPPCSRSPRICSESVRRAPSSATFVTRPADKRCATAARVPTFGGCGQLQPDQRPPPRTLLRRQVSQVSQAYAPPCVSRPYFPPLITRQSCVHCFTSSPAPQRPLRD